MFSQTLQLFLLAYFCFNGPVLGSAHLIKHMYMCTNMELNTQLIFVWLYKNILYWSKAFIPQHFTIHVGGLSVINQQTY